MLPKSLACFFGLLLYFTPGFGQWEYPFITCGFNDSIPEEGLEPEGLFNCNNSLSTFQNAHITDLIPQGIFRTLKIRTNVILMQRQGGTGNFSLSNPDHVQFLNDVFDLANEKLTQLIYDDCSCTAMPINYPNIHIEFVPNFVEVQDEFYWNHRNDPQQFIYNSYNKPYLMAIHDLATAHPDYQSGIDLIITSDKTFYDLMVQNPQTPLWEFGYNHYYNGYWYSASAEFDLPHPAMWHAPDEFLIYDNGIRHLGGPGWLENIHIPWVAGVFLHEYFHYFDLGHISDVACPDNVTNIMENGGLGATSATSLTGCQVRTIYLT